MAITAASSCQRGIYIENNNIEEMKITVLGKKDSVWSKIGENTLPVMQKDDVTKIIPFNFRRDTKKFIIAYDSIMVIADKENIKRIYSSTKMTKNMQIFPY